LLILVPYCYCFHYYCFKSVFYDFSIWTSGVGQFEGRLQSRMGKWCEEVDKIIQHTQKTVQSGNEKETFRKWRYIHGYESITQHPFEYLSRYPKSSGEHLYYTSSNLGQDLIKHMGQGGVQPLARRIFGERWWWGSQEETAVKFIKSYIKTSISSSKDMYLIEQVGAMIPSLPQGFWRTSVTWSTPTASVPTPGRRASSKLAEWCPCHLQGTAKTRWRIWSGWTTIQDQLYVSPGSHQITRLVLRQRHRHHSPPSLLGSPATTAAFIKASGSCGNEDFAQAGPEWSIGKLESGG